VETRTGLITFHRRTPKGGRYLLFAPEEGNIGLFARAEPFLLFDRVEAVYVRRCDTLFLQEWTILDRSPLARHPERLVAAAYFAHLARCFTEGRGPEQAFVERIPRLLEERIGPDTIVEAEVLWARAMGLRIDGDDRVGAVIHDHIGAAAYRLREQVTTVLSRREESHA